MSGGGNPTVTSTSTFTPSQDQQSLIDMIMPGAKSQLAQGFQQYQGPTVAGFDPLQTQGQNAALTAAGGAGADIGTSGAGALRTLLDPNMLNIGANPNFTNLAGTMTSLADRNLLQTILPGVTSGSTVAGGQYAGGGTRGDLAVGKAIGDTAIGTNAGIAQLAEQMYQSGIQGMTSAAGMVPLMQQAQLFAPNVMNQVGAQRQALDQATMNDLSSRFWSAQMLPWLNTQMGAQLLGSIPGGTQTNVQHGATPQSSPFQTAMGSMMGLGSLAPMLNWMFPTAAGATGGLSSMFGSIGTGLGSLFSGIGSGGSSLLGLLGLL